MARADVVVIGAGLSGLVAGARLAELGASVHLVAKGHASTHWGTGGIDVAAVPGMPTPRASAARLAGLADHPYAFLEPDLADAVAWLGRLLADGGLAYAGGLDDAIAALPTAIGSTRPAAIVPDAQSAGLPPWRPGERLVVAGPTGYKDFWPSAIAAGLALDAAWPGYATRPAGIDAVAIELPGLEGLRNLTALTLARRFDDPAWRRAALDRIAAALEPLARRGANRVALPAVLGLHDHAAALADARARLPLLPFEVALVPPSVPGMRLFAVLRNRIREAGGRVQVGEAVHAIERDGERDDGRVVAVRMAAATRDFRIITRALVLATGGIAGGGLRGTADGLVEPVLGLPVTAPPRAGWFAADALDPAGHPLEAAGIVTDERLRPLGPQTRRAVGPGNVRVVGAMLAGQHAIRQRCGDGVALASGWRAANELGAGGGGVGRRPAAAASPSPAEAVRA